MAGEQSQDLLARQTTGSLIPPLVRWRLVLISLERHSFHVNVTANKVGHFRRPADKRSGPMTLI